MTFSPRDWLIVAGGLAVIVAVLLGSALLAGTPGAAIPDDLGRTPGATPPSGETVDYELPEGGSASVVGEDLERLGVISSGTRFELLLTLMGLQNSLGAGEYTLPLGSSTLTVIEQLRVRAAGEVVQLTFIEGTRIEEMAEAVEGSGFTTADEFLQAASEAALPSPFDETLPQGHNKQGYLFPDTYILPEEATATDLVELMIETLALRFDASLRQAAAAHGLNPHEALTLASIVEREAVLPEERPLIAGVFLNRIEAGDLIGADPTVQFAVAQDPANVEEYGWWKAELTLDDLQNPSPYNTRLNPGIPPGPIANPGLASIEAVANATETDLYYFVADTIAGDGSHVFAETLEEHEANIARMQAGGE